MTTGLSDKEKVNNAFRELRKLGYTAKQNFMCCSSCAWYELGGTALAGVRNEALPPPEKVVFYNKQANASAWFTREYWSEKNRRTFMLQSHLWLQWAGNGQEIVAALQRQGLNVEWNGTEEQGICIVPAAKE